MTNHLQAVIDFSHEKADFGLPFPDGQPLGSHISFRNLTAGYATIRRVVLEALDTYHFEGIDVSAGVTGYLWLPPFLQLSANADLASHDLDLLPPQPPLGQMVQEMLRRGLQVRREGPLLHRRAHPN